MLIEHNIWVCHKICGISCYIIIRKRANILLPKIPNLTIWAHIANVLVILARYVSQVVDARKVVLLADNDAALIVVMKTSFEILYFNY